MSGPEELEELSEEFGDQLRRIESGSPGSILVASFILTHQKRLAQQAGSGATVASKCTKVD